MALCKHGCGTDLTWMKSASDGVSRPYGPDGMPHRCAEGLAAFRTGKTVPIASHVPEPSFSGITAATQPYSAPVERSEVQELRHAVQRLSRAVELLSEVVQELAARELAR